MIRRIDNLFRGRSLIKGLVTKFWQGRGGYTTGGGGGQVKFYPYEKARLKF